MEKVTEKKYYYGLDIFRIIAAFMVCMFHTTVHLGCNYGFFNGMSQMGAVFMTGFFILSGYVLFLNWSGKNLNDFNDIKSFWKRRIISIIPMYFIASLFYIILNLILKNDSIVDTALLFPVEFFGIQSVFSSLFSISHNGGTWFISCILICYLIYPFIQEIVKKLGKKVKLVVLFIVVFLLFYAPFVVHHFELNTIYSNPFFRFLEFFIGILLVSIKNDYQDTKIIRVLSNIWIALIAAIAMVVLVCLGVYYKIGVGNYMLYSIICLPCFCIIILGLSALNIENRILCIVIRKLSLLTYAFFLAQLFSNTVSKLIIDKFSIDNNFLLILIGWSSCIIIALLLRIIEICINKFLLNRIK